MYLVKTPKLIQSLMPGYIWRIPTKEKVLHLTFDDGPIPEITPWVLDVLAQYQAKATFFCVGENVKKHPEIFKEIVQQGHAVGNHTYNHLNGWETENIHYFHNIRHCAQLVKSDLFRPPYGRISPSQGSFLERHYKIVMWDILSGDFDPNLSKEKCLENVLTHTREGSIVVLHDSVKAQEKMQYVLPRILDHFTKEGYIFETVRYRMQMAVA